MEQEEVVQTRPEPPGETTRELVGKKLNLEWIESEWFSVWLKLARGEQDSPKSEEESTPELQEHIQ